MTTTATGKADTPIQADDRSEGDIAFRPQVSSASSGLPTLPELVHLDLGGDSCLPGQPCD